MLRDLLYPGRRPWNGRSARTVHVGTLKHLLKEGYVRNVDLLSYGGFEIGIEG